MRIAPAHRTPSSEDGFVLIEILVSALVLALVAAGVAALLSATTRSAADERNKSEAYSLAQEDLARLRAMRISDLSRLPSTPRTVTLNKTAFKVKSTGTFVNDSTAISSCSEGSSSADYVSVASEVTWTGSRVPVVLRSIVSPTSGALDPSHGNVNFAVKTAAGLPLAGVTFTSSAFTGTTDANGCITFPDIATGTYTVTPSGATVGRVDKDGKAPAAMSVGVPAEVTTLVQLSYDVPGAIDNVFFTARPSPGAAPLATKADSIVVSNIKMTEAKSFGTPGGTRQLSLPASSLYPFSTPDAVYAGSCGNNNPNPNGESNPPGAAAVASVLITANGHATATVQLPALYLNVWKGTPSKPETAVTAAHVIVTDKGCKVGNNQVKRTYTGTSEGHLPASELGLPWGSYEVCADNGTRRQTLSTVALQNLEAGTAVDIYLGSGTGTVSQNGICS